MSGQVPVSFAYESALLHEWRVTVDGLTSLEGPLDPAQMARLSGLLEAVRLVADAAEADPLSLRRCVVDDLRLFTLRLSRDFGRAVPENVVRLRDMDLSSSLVALAGVLDAVAGRMRHDDFVPRDGRVDLDRTGVVDRRAMLRWVSASVVEANAVDDVLLSRSREVGADAQALVRDGWTLVSTLATVSAALSDNCLVEVDHVSERLDLAASLCDQAGERCDAMEAAGSGDLSDIRKAFLSARTLVLGAYSVVDGVEAGIPGARVKVRWRLVSKGKVILSDAEVASLFESGDRSLDTVAPLDLATARAFGNAARSLRTEWVA